MKKPDCLWTFWMSSQHPIKSKANRICQAQNRSLARSQYFSSNENSGVQISLYKHYRHIIHTPTMQNSSGRQQQPALVSYSCVPGSRFERDWVMKYTTASPACTETTSCSQLLTLLKGRPDCHWHYTLSHSIWWVNHINWIVHWCKISILCTSVQ